MADAHRGDLNEKKKDKRHRANRQKLTRKRTDRHEHLKQINIVNKRILNVKKHLKQINIVNNQIVNVRKHSKQIEHSKRSNNKC